MGGACRIGGLSVGAGRPLAVIGGPCALEDEPLALRVATTLAGACRELGFSYIFKGSFDKANRTSGDSLRGPGIERGLGILEAVREQLGVPVTTDLHEPAQADAVARSVDLLQIPAFLCRQTDLLVAAGRAAARHGRAVNIKKGQFLSPAEILGPARKVTDAGCADILLTERGTFFGYGRLVNDFIGLADLGEMRAASAGPWPVCFDCTHSTQLPGAGERGEKSGGRPERAPMLARAAVAAGVDAVFIECHPEPSKAPSDASTMLRLNDVPALLGALARLRAAIAPQAAPL